MKVIMDKKTFIYKEVTDEHINDNYFEIDENIAEAISILNKKGYYTKYCCEGHMMNIEEDVFAISVPYVLFETNISIPHSPKGWSVCVEDEIMDNDSNIIHGQWINLSSPNMFQAETRVEMMSAKFSALNELLLWANELPITEDKKGGKNNDRN